MNHVQLALRLDAVIRRLAYEWISNHSALYAPMDGPRPKWDRLLKRPYVPVAGAKPVVIDRFFPPMSGGAVTYWLLMGQMIGPCYSREEPVDTLEEYWQLWAEGFQAAAEYQDQVSRLPPHTPWLWTLEAPPPHLF